jgi:hypothetical protein
LKGWYNSRNNRGSLNSWPYLGMQANGRRIICMWSIPHKIPRIRLTPSRNEEIRLSQAALSRLEDRRDHGQLVNPHKASRRIAMMKRSVDMITGRQTLHSW